MAPTDLAWYNAMRAAYPSDTEDWLWPLNTPYFVTVDGVEIQVRRYLWEQLIGTGTPPKPFYPLPTCDERCVNPHHMTAKRMPHRRPMLPAQMLDYASTDAAVTAIRGAVGFGKTREDLQEARKQLYFSGGVTIDRETWLRLVPVVARAELHGESDIWSVSLASGVYIDLTTVPAEAVAGMPSDYATSTGQPPLEEM